MDDAPESPMNEDGDCSPPKAEADIESLQPHGSVKKSPSADTDPSIHNLQSGSSVLTSPSESQKRIPDKVRNLIKQLNLVTQMLGMFEKRLSHTEEVMMRIEERMAAIESESPKQPHLHESTCTSGVR